MTCRRCLCEDVAASPRGLCKACELTSTLPGFEPAAWELRLTNEEAKPQAPTVKADQPSLF